MDYYVEDLSRIGSISIIVQSQNVQTPITELPELQLSNETQIILTFRQYPESSPLVINTTSPIRQSVTAENFQNLTTLRNGIISIKLPSCSSVTQTSRNTLMETPYQWDTKFLQSLQPSFSLTCVNCGNKILDSDKLTHISEMPSEIWAELMDFWHCHKPHHHHQGDSHDDEHKESLGHRFDLKVPQNTLLTGSYYFAVNLQDEQLQRSVMKKKNEEEEEEEEGTGKVYCLGCQSVLGEVDKVHKVDKLLKWQVGIITVCGKELRYDPWQFVYYTLLDNVNGTATRLIEFITRKKMAEKRLLVWIFNTEINYFLTKDQNIHKNALKVYYTTVPQNIDEERTNRGEIETIFISEKVMDDTLLKLESVNSKLPLSVRTMGKGWNMSLLGN